jgi:hypothetical protein
MQKKIFKKFSAMLVFTKKWTHQNWFQFYLLAMLIDQEIKDNFQEQSKNFLNKTVKICINEMYLYKVNVNLYKSRERSIRIAVFIDQKIDQK